MRLAASMGNMPKGLLSVLFDDNASLVTGCTDLLLVELAGAPQIRGSECDCPPPMATCRRGSYPYPSTTTQVSLRGEQTCSYWSSKALRGSEDLNAADRIQ